MGSDVVNIDTAKIKETVEIIKSQKEKKKMTKQETIDMLDGLIKEAKKFADKVNDAMLKDNNKSPRIVNCISCLYNEVARSIANFESVKADIDKHDKVALDAAKVFDMPIMCDDGLCFDGEED